MGSLILSPLTFSRSVSRPYLSFRSKFVNDTAYRMNFLRHQVLQSPPTSPLPATTSSESELKMEQRLANTLRITVNEKKFIETALLSVQGYALIEYENFEESQKAINEMDRIELLTQTINVDWAFSKGPFKRRNMWRSTYHHVDTVQEVLGEGSNHARICGFIRSVSRPHLSLRSKFVNDTAYRTNFLRHQVLQSPPTSPLPATTSSESRLGYALIEYENFEESQKAINEMDGTELLTQTITVDWAFSKGPFKRRIMRRMTTNTKKDHHVDTIQEVLGEDSNHARICGFMLE
ncbi:unnamed protein product [Camellia sinensis]